MYIDLASERNTNTGGPSLGQKKDQERGTARFKQIGADSHSDADLGYTQHHVMSRAAPSDFRVAVQTLPEFMGSSDSHVTLSPHRESMWAPQTAAAACTRDSSDRVWSKRHGYISVHISWLKQEKDKLIFNVPQACNQALRHPGSSFRA